MADKYTDVGTQQNDYLETTAERQKDGYRVSGVVLHAEALYTFDGTESNDDVIKIVLLPEGATVIPHLCQMYVNFATGDEDADISIGDNDATTAVDPDRYSVLQAIDAAGTGIEAFAFSHATAAAGLTPYKLQANSWIEGLLAGLANTASGDSIRFKLCYSAQA